MVSFLLAEDGIKPDIKDNSGRTPLWWATEKGYGSVVKLLLATNGVDPEAEDNYDQTPLLRAIERGHSTVVELLLARMLQTSN